MTRDAMRNKLGFTLIEITIVLGIVGLIAGGIFAAWASVSSQNRMRAAEEQISMIVNQIRSTYGNRSGLDTSVTGAAFTSALIEAGLLSDSWVDTTNGVSTLRNPYGGTVVVTPDAYSGGSVNDGINISFSSVAQAECKKLGNDMVGIGRREGLYKIDAVAVNNATQYSDVSGSICSTTTVRFYFTLKTGD